MILDLEEIKKLLPHRDPFLFIDKCEITSVGKSGKGYKKFLDKEYFFKGHFPEMPIVPGVILIESLAQTAGLVVAKGLSKEKEKSVLFMSVSNAKFRKPVFPNDEVIFEIEIINKVRTVYKCYGEAKRNNEKVCESTFSAMIVDKQ
ncbi:MAG: 3-hydroxyacyl-[acyl-carrier-protein] dehydratase FabZ [Alphaproteobacteria bacterium MarineAlpha5_Bin9]|nr:MAG: 3-hydroxyacyl-[acyl-carrier-protein] dehydratase FabZ [Alphaproteobacteria bacterium MarineAlpha5_Bin9]|tara:strand:- start:14320 stop:14757 length:438 start_codon:yes stop_codon:yes gene_type:complete